MDFYPSASQASVIVVESGVELAAYPTGSLKTGTLAIVKDGITTNAAGERPTANDTPVFMLVKGCDNNNAAGQPVSPYVATGPAGAGSTRIAASDYDSNGAGHQSGIWVRTNITFLAPA